MANSKVPDKEYIDSVGVLTEELALSRNETSKELKLTHREAFTVKKFAQFLPGVVSQYRLDKIYLQIG